MEDLSDLIHFFSSHYAKKIETIGIKENSLLFDLYIGILNGTFKNDEDAAYGIYEKSPKSKSYQKLKYKLYKRLLDGVLLIDLSKPKYNERQRAFKNCHKNWAIGKVLISRGLRKPGIKLFEQTIRVALLNQYSFLIIDICTDLKRHFSRYDSNPKKFQKYFEIHEQYTKIYELEVIAEDYHSKLKTTSVKKRGVYSEELAEKAMFYLEDLKEKKANLESKKLNYYYYLILIFRYEIISDYENIIKACQTSIDKFDNFQGIGFLYGNYARIFVAQITLKRFEAALSTLKTINSIDFPQSSSLWFQVKKLTLVLYWHMKDYQYSLEIFLDVFHNSNLKRLQQLTQNEWKLVEAHVHLLIEFGRIDPIGYEKRLRKFKLTRFLNDIPGASKDKQGHNIQVLIIQVIFLLRLGKIEEALNRIQVLNQYRNKYLKKDQTYRSNVFIKMLIVLIQNQLHKAATERKSAKYIKLLEEHPIQKSKQSIGVEMIPYEDLWDMILEETDNSFRFTPAKKRKVDDFFKNKGMF